MALRVGRSRGHRTLLVLLASSDWVRCVTELNLLGEAVPRTRKRGSIAHNNRNYLPPLSFSLRIARLLSTSLSVWRFARAPSAARAAAPRLTRSREDLASSDPDSVCEQLARGCLLEPSMLGQLFR
jgi:hypothetical protein